MADTFKKTFEGKKIFLTGHTGFKGAWLWTWCHLLGAKVKGYSLVPKTEADLYNVIKGKELGESVIGDIMDSQKLKKEILDFQPDFVFHLAAQALVRPSYQTPVETFGINAIGTVHVLEALRYMEKPCIVVLVTTDKVYHNIEQEYSYKEEDPLGGYDPYSASKAAAEIMIDSYRKSFFNPAHYSSHQKSIAVARAGNVIGGGDWSEDRLVPDIIKSLIKKEPVIIRNPNSVRPWQHVLESIRGYLTLASAQYKDPVKYAQAYNFGPNTEDVLKVKEFAELAIACWGQGEYKTPPILNAQHEAGLLKLSIEKAKMELNWIPKYTSQKAIEKTINWYKNYLTDPSKALQMVKQEIEYYDTYVN